MTKRIVLSIIRQLLIIVIVIVVYCIYRFYHPIVYYIDIGDQSFVIASKLTVQNLENSFPVNQKHFTSLNMTDPQYINILSDMEKHDKKISLDQEDEAVLAKQGLCTLPRAQIYLSNDDPNSGIVLWQSPHGINTMHKFQYDDSKQEYLPYGFSKYKFGVRFGAVSTN